jgi:hypothetical protein
MPGSGTCGWVGTKSGDSFGSRESFRQSRALRLKRRSNGKPRRSFSSPDRYWILEVHGWQTL